MYGDVWCIAVHDFAQLHVLDRPPLVVAIAMGSLLVIPGQQFAVAKSYQSQRLRLKKT